MTATTAFAEQIVAGDEVTDQYGHSYKVARVARMVAQGRGIYLYPEDQGYPEFYLNGSPITINGRQQVVPVPAKAATGPVLGELTRKYIAEAQADLASIRRTGYDDGKWRYMKWTTPEGRTISREYRTQKGFNEAYIREARRGCDILIAE